MKPKAVKNHKFQGFVLFLIGAFGPTFAPNVQQYISKCNVTVFTLALVTILYIIVDMHFKEQGP